MRYRIVVIRPTGSPASPAPGSRLGPEPPAPQGLEAAFAAGRLAQAGQGQWVQQRVELLVGPAWSEILYRGEFRQSGGLGAAELSAG